jgi:hypothetical protein
VRATLRERHPHSSAHVHAFTCTASHLAPCNTLSSICCRQETNHHDACMLRCIVLLNVLPNMLCLVSLVSMSSIWAARSGCDGCGDQGVEPRPAAGLPDRHQRHLRPEQRARRLPLCDSISSFLLLLPRHVWGFPTAVLHHQRDTPSDMRCFRFSTVVCLPVAKASTTAATAWRVPTAAWGAWGARWTAMSACAAASAAVADEEDALTSVHDSFMHATGTRLTEPQWAVLGTLIFESLRMAIGIERLSVCMWHAWVFNCQHKCIAL